MSPGHFSVSESVKAYLYGFSVSVIITVLTVFVLGCARAGGDPINPINGLSVTGAAASAEIADADMHDPHMLWGQWIMFISEDRTSVDVVPMRQARLHLNALKFLESYCADCVQVTKIKNNGDGTIDLTVRITHPFNGFPEYTGFDVKGIIMFNGSNDYSTPPGWHGPLPTPTFKISWREMGDPEVLNPDGYAYRWTPAYDSGSDLPIFKYWEGKYATGVPNADLNAYLNFYSQEQRHIFRTDASVVRTYKIWLPPGPVVAGYAVEACWEPPLVTPVVNPVTDFPATANQPEAYHFNVVVNNGDVITNCEDCCSHDFNCDISHVEQAQWGGMTAVGIGFFWHDWSGGTDAGWWFGLAPPCKEDWYPWLHELNTCEMGNGIHRIVAYNYWFDGEYHDYAFDIFDITVNDPTL